MNNFIENFHQDVHRATYISAFRSLIALEERIARTAVFLTDTEDSFKEIFYNGTHSQNSSIAVADLSALPEGIELLQAERHNRKLNRGTHRSNAFRLVVRELSGQTELLDQALERIRQQGVANYFGESSQK